MIRKIIKIDEEKCNGCGLCAAACHEGAIGMAGGKAKLLREDYCDGLGDCLARLPRRTPSRLKSARRPPMTRRQWRAQKRRRCRAAVRPRNRKRSNAGARPKRLTKHGANFRNGPCRSNSSLSTRPIFKAPAFSSRQTAPRTPAAIFMADLSAAASHSSAVPNWIWRIIPKN